MPKVIEFRNRAHEVSRLEAFSDVIFGFAISLLVVSLEAPKSFHELTEMMRGIVPFGICFFIFIDIWFEHHDFFRRYALHDGIITALNTLLLFVVLFYVYPLKYVFVSFTESFRGRHVGLQIDDLPALFTIYGAGVTAVFTILALMYRHAWKKRDELELNEVERIDTRSSIWDNAVMAAFGVLSTIMANVLPPRLAMLAGFIYTFIGIPKWLIPRYMGRRRRAAEQRATSLSRPQFPRPDAPEEGPGDGQRGNADRRDDRSAVIGDHAGGE